MKHIREVDFQQDYLVIRYQDDDDPPWAQGRELIVGRRKHPHVDRLTDVAYRIFELLVSRPGDVAQSDEILQEWLVKRFNRVTEEDYERL